jgi:prepilin peptidase CpaA
MPGPLLIAYGALLIPLAFIITYYDVRYRRIPNAFVLSTLAGGILLNTIFAGAEGALASLGGCALGFILMFILHVFGAMGAGDVKLFAAIGSVTGSSLIFPMFLVVVLVGGALAIVSSIRAGAVRSTALRVVQILAGLMPGWQMPRFAVPADKKLTIPYGVAITLGSIITVAVFRA